MYLLKFLFRVKKPALVILAIFISVGGTIYLARTKPELLGIPFSQQIVGSQQDLDKLIGELGKIIALPEGEIPTVATVTEVDKIKNQPFFALAQNGDKVLVYTNARKAILYRPSEKKIIEVGVVNINQETTQLSQEVSPTPNEIIISEAPTPTRSPNPSPVPTSKPTSTSTPSISGTP